MTKQALERMAEAYALSSLGENERLVFEAYLRSENFKALDELFPKIKPTSLAYLAGALAMRDKCAEVAKEFATNYPLSVFPEPEPGCAVDRYSASSARNTCEQIEKDILALGTEKE